LPWFRGETRATLPITQKLTPAGDGAYNSYTANLGEPLLARNLRSEGFFGSQPRSSIILSNQLLPKLQHLAAGCPPGVAWPAAVQFTKRLRRTLFTSPSIKKFDKTLDPPALISGNGIPVVGIRPTTIPALTST
jgi:hypothetical protein